jgi:lysophospholipase L1-like esterase
MNYNDRSNIFRIILLQLIAFVPTGCETVPQKELDLPPYITCPIPYFTDLAVDGMTADWDPSYVPLRILSDVCGNIPDTNDFRASFRMAWSEKGIYLLAEIRDDSLYEDPDNFWHGDGLELFLSPGRGSPNILQVSVRPGFDLPDAISSFNAYDHLRSEPISIAETNIAFCSRKTSLGYLLEGMVPLEMIRVEPHQDLMLAIQLYLNDADRKDDPENFSLPWYSVRESYRNPYAFHSVVLTADRYPEMSPELRACIVDGKTLQLKFISDRPYVGQVFHMISGTFNFRFKNTPVKAWTLPVDKISSEGKPLVGLLLEDQPLQVLDLGMAHYVYEQTDPPEWYENEIRIFEIMDRYNPPPDSAVLFTGSSTIRRWYSLSGDMYPQIVINRGFGGSVMNELNGNIDRIVFPYKPSRIFVYEGDNDIARGAEPAVFLDECSTFISHCQGRLPNTEIIFLSIKPSPSRMRYWKQMEQANQMLEYLCNKHENVIFLDISSPMFSKPGILKNDIYAKDGLHLNEKGYSLLRQVIMDHIMKPMD